MTVIADIFIVIKELAITTGIWTKEERAEIETHPVTVEARISKCSAYFKILQTFLYLSFSNLFCFILQLNDFLFYLFLSVWILDLCFLQWYFWYCSILLIKPRIFSISIDSFLNIFLSLLPNFLQIIQRTDVFSKKYDILRFLNFS